MSLRRVSFATLIVVLGLVLAAPLAIHAYDYSYARVVRLSLVDGDVQVYGPRSQDDDRSTEQGWEQAVVNLPLQQGYSLATRQGRAEIEFESGATARLAENSVLQFTELALSGGGRITKLTLTQGTATFYANLSREDSFVVLTPSMQVTIPENARFRVDASNDGSTLSVLKGNVSVDSSAGTSRLTKGHALAFRAGDDQARVTRNAESDAWDRWVADREEVVRTGNTAALQYVSSPYSYGLSDLYSYGGWYSFGGYGPCWRPYGAGFGWSPYWNGRWAFYPGLGWTWVSYEPWGWLPYHFGGWVFSPNLGWLWVPGRFRQWQPAQVTWVRVGNRVGWVPLNPHDRPGQTPTNLQQGVLTQTTNGFIGARPNASNGFIGARPNAQTGSIGVQPSARVIVTGQDKIEVLAAPPANFVAAPMPAPAAVRGSTPAAEAAAASPAAPTIVFDPKERKFVNNPAGPVQKYGRIGDAEIDKSASPGSRGSVAPAPSAPPAPPSGPRGGTTVIPTPPTRQTAQPPTPPTPRTGTTAIPTPPMRKGGRIGDADMDVGRTPMPLRPPDAAPRQAPPPTPPRVETPRLSPPPPPRAERPLVHSNFSPVARQPRMQPMPCPASPPPAPRASTGSGAHAH